uniref:Uncharacterized protein n=1 Tax=Urocitellus parryii TaxID=9999 RepID=A0A8D2KFN5_UROPR
MFLKCILPKSPMSLLRVCLFVISQMILQKPLVEKALVKRPLKISLLMILKMREFSVLQSFRSSLKLFMNSYRFCLKYLSVN